MGRDGDVTNTFGGETPRMCQRGGIIGCSVVHRGKQVEMQIDV
jgi:hypothetical protein